MGSVQAPVVITEQDHWSGFRPDKIKAIKDWKDLRTIKDVQAFIGFANFYRRFIYKFSLIVRPLIELIRDTPVGQRLNFNDKARAAFERLKVSRR